MGPCNKRCSVDFRHLIPPCPLAVAILPGNVPTPIHFRAVRRTRWGLWDAGPCPWSFLYEFFGVSTWGGIFPVNSITTGERKAFRIPVDYCAAAVFDDLCKLDVALICTNSLYNFLH